MDPLVSICCITYNHEAFISGAIDGFLKQETNFDYEIIIGEDCSTDNTRKIIDKYANKYPGLIQVITSDSNVGPVLNEYRTLLAAKGKYIAFCEGDDYWTDSLKLQKQVDFLEANTGYSVCFHRCRHYNVKTGQWSDDHCGTLFSGDALEGIDITMDMFFRQWITQPLTMVFHRNALDINIVIKYKHYRDMHLIYHLLRAGKGFLFAFIGGVYNLHVGGINSLLENLEWCKKSLPIDKEFFKVNRTKEAKNNYLQTLQSSIIEYTRIKNKPKAMFLCLEHFMISGSLKRFYKNLKLLV